MQKDPFFISLYIRLLYEAFRCTALHFILTMGKQANLMSRAVRPAGDTQAHKAIFGIIVQTKIRVIGNIQFQL